MRRPGCHEATQAAPDPSPKAPHAGEKTRVRPSSSLGLPAPLGANLTRSAGFTDGDIGQNGARHLVPGPQILLPLAVGPMFLFSVLAAPVVLLRK